MTRGASPLVSVCIATYNQATWIEACLLSVIAQTGDLDVEILVGNDCSTDETPLILERLQRQYPGRIQLVSRSSNLGPISNYRDLVARATGEFVAHLDGDDSWLPGKLRAQVNFLHENPECAAVYTNAVALDRGGMLVGPFTDSHPKTMTLGYLTARGNFLMHSSILYRAAHRDIFLHLPAQSVDYALHLRLATRGLLGFIDRPLAIYTVGTPTSMLANAYPLVERLIWAALKSVASDLTRGERRQCAAHFAAEEFLGRVLSRTKHLQISFPELAQFAEIPRARLLLRASLAVARIGVIGVLRRCAIQLNLLKVLARHPRA
jgi:hypothetical protein